MNIVVCCSVVGGAPSAAPINTTIGVVQASGLGGLSGAIVRFILPSPALANIEGSSVVAIIASLAPVGSLRGIEGVLPVAQKAPAPVLASGNNFIGGPFGVLESADDLTQGDITNGGPGVALGNHAWNRVDVIVLGDLLTSLDELFMRGFSIGSESGGDSEGGDELHK